LYRDNNSSIVVTGGPTTIEVRVAVAVVVVVTWHRVLLINWSISFRDLSVLSR